MVQEEDVDEAWRLHREALKQSATDPLSGKIDVSILTTGVSSSARKKRLELSQFVKKTIMSKKDTPNIDYSKLFGELKESSDIQITREQYEDALHDLEDEGLITVLGKTSIRIKKGIRLDWKCLI